ncbi:MAG: rhodanese-related sulfurtransferase, partial [Gracilimonas sp.]
MYQVILYYNFEPIKDPDQFCKDHKQFCKEIGLKGRIYISEEGINGTAAGTDQQIEEYKKYLWSLPGFDDTEFKQDESEYIPFPRLTCKVREEIVALHKEDVNPENGGNYLAPDEWKNVMESGEDYVMIDVRNNYESKIGHFEGAIQPDVDNFYDFPQWLDEADIPKDKKVLMYCTGGIRCEKFSVLMKEKGWEDVNQLHGGILKYAKK